MNNEEPSNTSFVDDRKNPPRWGSDIFNLQPSPARPQQPVAAPRQTPAIHVELSDGTLVDVHTSGPLTAGTIVELLDYLSVYKKVLDKRETTPQG